MVLCRWPQNSNSNVSRPSLSIHYVLSVQLPVMPPACAIVRTHTQIRSHKRSICQFCHKSRIQRTKKRGCRPVFWRICPAIVSMFCVYDDLVHVCHFFASCLLVFVYRLGISWTSPTMIIVERFDFLLFQATECLLTSIATALWCSRFAIVFISLQKTHPQTN